MCAPSDSGEAHSRPPPGTATRRPLTGRLCARAGPRLGRTDRGGGRPESSAVTTATCEHRPPHSPLLAAAEPQFYRRRRACWVACCTGP